MEPLITDSGGWSRSRIVFLGLSGVLVLALLWWASAAILPFVLALIIAYVLTPLVAFAERRRVPRSLSIVLVYALTLGGLYFSIAAMTPRLYDETLKFAKDVPNLTMELTQRWAPRLENVARGIQDRVSPPDSTPQPEPAPAFEVKKKADGSFAVELLSGVDIVQDGPKRWRVVPQQTEVEKRFSVAQLTSDGLTQLVAYIKLNAIDLIRFGQKVFSQIARGIFLFFMT